MHETLDFIFKTLNRHDGNFMTISKGIRKQRKFNNWVTLFSFSMLGITFLQESKLRSLEREIEKMKEEVEK